VDFVFSPFGSAGDVYPMLGTAIELKQRGHQVTFVTSGYFRDTIERTGIEFEEIGSKEEFIASTSNADLWHPARGFRYVFGSLIQPGLRAQYETFARHFKRGASLGIVNMFGFGGLVAREKLNVPIVSLHVQPAVIWSRVAPPKLPRVVGPRWLQDLQFRLGERFFIDRAVCPSLNALRSELGLAPVRRIVRWWNSPAGVVCTFPSWYCEPQADWPTNVAQTDFRLWDELADELPREIEEFLAAGERPIVFTPGSGNQFGVEFFRSAVEACRRLGCRGVLCSKFAEHIPENLPAGIKWATYAPFSRLLPRAAAVVHHGGVGTVAQALSAGVPQLVMPLAHDQFDNAQRVRRLGVGDALVPRKFTGAAAARKLAALVSSSEVAGSCRATAARLSRRDGCQRTADALEGFARRSNGQS
jgi:UDP:flavonoid glycosyltransferase YjiC (YdhE family)